MNHPTIAVLNRPNSHVFEKREPKIYGRDPLSDLENHDSATAVEAGFGVDFRQSDHDGVLADAIQELRHPTAGIIIIPTAFSHTSVAIHDAPAAARCPVIEVHLSNMRCHEPWCNHSYVSSVADTAIMDCGIQGNAHAILRVACLAKADRR